MADPTLVVTPEVVKADGKNRVANTGAQVGGAGAIIIVGDWIAHLAGWHGEIPTPVVGALEFLLSGGIAALMHLSKLKGRA